MFEVGQLSANAMTYHEAIMYCFCLGDGWRLPTAEEYMSTRYKYLEGGSYTWAKNDVYLTKSLSTCLLVLPVRTIESPE